MSPPLSRQAKVALLTMVQLRMDGIPAKLSPYGSLHVPPVTMYALRRREYVTEHGATWGPNRYFELTDAGIEAAMRIRS